MWGNTMVEIITAALLLLIASRVESQVVNITSTVVQSGRNFACPNELVTYSCSAQGSGIIGIAVQAVPFISDGFSTGDTVSETRVLNNAVLTLTSIAPVWSLLLHIQSASPSNVACSDADGTPLVTLPLSVSASPQPPSNIRLSLFAENGTGWVFCVSWDQPVSPQYDIGRHLIVFFVNNVEVARRNSVGDQNSDELKYQFDSTGTFVVRVDMYTYSACVDQDRSGLGSSPNVTVTVTGNMETPETCTYPPPLPCPSSGCSLFCILFIIALIILIVTIGIYAVSLVIWCCEYAHQKSKIASLEQRIEELQGGLDMKKRDK